jgi:hypothetical protein
VGGTIARMLAEQTVQCIDEINWARLLCARGNGERSNKREEEQLRKLRCFGVS